MNINQFTEFLSNTIGWNKHNIQRRVRSLREEGPKLGIGSDKMRDIKENY